MNLSTFRTEEPISGRLFMEATRLHMATLANMPKFEMRKFVRLTREELAKYADPVTKSNVDQKWYQEQLRNPKMDRYNRTMVANIAYASIHCSDDEIKLLCIKKIDGIRKQFAYQHCVIQGCASAIVVLIMTLIYFICFAR